ncbi:heme exporter protein CcmD [Bosea sp. TAF32]|uniref:heme exporter protein CcmD n=1 Tax=Bosea sp. TAF32 TaxID=3237482 RepID=UPI003F937166
MNVLVESIGPHAGFILAAYAAAALILIGLTLATLRDHRAQKQALDALERRGAGRRSGRETS